MFVTYIFHSFYPPKIYLDGIRFVNSKNEIDTDTIMIDVILGHHMRSHERSFQ